MRPVGVGRDGRRQGLAEQHLARGHVHAVEDAAVRVFPVGCQAEQSSRRNLDDEPGRSCLGDRHDLAHDLPRGHVVNEQLGLLRALDCRSARPPPWRWKSTISRPPSHRSDPVHGVAAEGLPEAVQLPRLRIVPAQAAAGVMTQSEPAEVELAIRAERGTVHEPDTSGPVEVPQVPRITPRRPPGPAPDGREVRPCPASSPARGRRRRDDRRNSR